MAMHRAKMGRSRRSVCAGRQDANEDRGCGILPQCAGARSTFNRLRMLCAITSILQVRESLVSRPELSDQRERTSTRRAAARRWLAAMPLWKGPDIQNSPGTLHCGRMPQPRCGGRRSSRSTAAGCRSHGAVGGDHPALLRQDAAATVRREAIIPLHCGRMPQPRCHFVVDRQAGKTSFFASGEGRWPGGQTLTNLRVSWRNLPRTVCEQTTNR